MKKSLLALAVLGAFAGVAHAQTNVTLYGIVDAAVRFDDNGSDDGDRWSLASGRQSASRIGFKGTEDLGGGLKADFVLEQGFNLDNGTNATTNKQFSRLAYVGLSGAFGGVRLGRQVTPLKAAIDAIDPFGGAGQAGIYDYIGVPEGTGGDTGITERVDNAVTYISPNFGGFTAQAQYVFGEVRGETSTNRQWGAQLGYGNGPVNVQLGYANEKADSSLLGADIDAKNFFVGAAYDLGVAKLHAGFVNAKYEPAAADDVKVRSYMIGATVPFGASSFTADYIRNDNRDIDDADSDSINLMYSYAMSKRTNVYAVYTHVKNDDLAEVGGADAGETAKALSVGIRHRF